MVGVIELVGVIDAPGDNATDDVGVIVTVGVIEGVIDTVGVGVDDG